MKFWVFFFLLLAFSLGMNAQTLSDTLDEFLLKEKKKTSNDERINTYSQGQKIVGFDSVVLLQFQQQNLSQLLTQQTPVFIKSYGFNGLATMNIRGASAAQSQVLWNGVPLTNAALGMADVSSLPVFFIQQMQLVYGSSGSLLGSGNVGGTISIETNQSKFIQQQKANIFLGAGSFGQYQAGGKMEIGNRKWQCTTGLFAQTANNNFEFKDNQGTQHTTQHAQLNGWSTVSSLSYEPNDKNTFSFSLWLQKYNRQIPAALFESYSDKERNDHSLRLFFDWQHKTRRGRWFAKTSFIKDKMNYNDASIQLFTQLKSYQSYSELGWQFKNKQHSWLVFIPVQLSWMPVGSTTKNLSQLAIAVAYQYSCYKWQFTGNTRLVTVNDKSIWLLGLTSNYQVKDNFLFRFCVQKTYRTPSLNELYYYPGGNDNLKPEYGWNEELGYKWTISFSQNSKLIQDVAVYNRQINNWIYWLGGAIWTPHNIASVSSTGLEIDHTFALKHGTINWNIGLNTSFVKAITIQSDIPNDGSIGKQIPYTPFANAVFHAGIQTARFSFNLNETYTGIRYINTDESGQLKDYFTTNVQGSFESIIANKNCRFLLQINNLFNEHYEVVSQRPMPGVNFLLGLDVKISKHQ